MANNKILDIGSRIEPFFDDWLISNSDGIKLQLHHPIPQEVAAATPALAETPHILCPGLAPEAQVALPLVDSTSHEHRLLTDGMVIKTLLRLKRCQRQEKSKE